MDAESCGDNVPESVELELVGGAKLTVDGKEVAFPARFIWTVRNGQTIRMLLFDPTEDCPILRVFPPFSLRRVGTIASDALTAFMAGAERD